MLILRLCRVFIAILATFLVCSLSLAQESKVYGGKYLIALKARILQTEQKRFEARMMPGDKNSVCLDGVPSFLVVFRFNIVEYAITSYCPTVGVTVQFNNNVYIDKNADGEVDAVVDGDGEVLYQNISYAPDFPKVNADDRSQRQSEFDSVFRKLEWLIDEKT